MDAFVDLLRPHFERMTFVLKHLALVFAAVLVWAGCTYMGLVEVHQHSYHAYMQRFLRTRPLTCTHTLTLAPL